MAFLAASNLCQFSREAGDRLRPRLRFLLLLVDSGWRRYSTRPQMAHSPSLNEDSLRKLSALCLSTFEHPDEIHKRCPNASLNSIWRHVEVAFLAGHEPDQRRNRAGELLAHDSRRPHHDASNPGTGPFWVRCMPISFVPVSILIIGAYSSGPQGSAANCD